MHEHFSIIGGMSLSCPQSVRLYVQSCLLSCTFFVKENVFKKTTGKSERTIRGTAIKEARNSRSGSLDRDFQETKLKEASTDGPSHVVFHRQIRLKHDAKVTNNSHRANQGAADTELPGVKMGTPSTGRAPMKLRLLGIKTQADLAVGQRG